MSNNKIEPTTKTYHRWTAEENQRLVAAVQEMAPLFEEAKGMSTAKAALLWAQIPGKIGVLVTPTSASMQYRTLTSDSNWAEKRRQRNNLRRVNTQEPASDGSAALDLSELAAEVREMRKEMARSNAEMRDLMQQLVHVWAPAPSPTTVKPVQPGSVPGVVSGETKRAEVAPIFGTKNKAQSA